jgi:hypothetical protein
MLLTKTVKIKWGNRNKNYYISKGYNFTKNGDEFEVKIEDVTENNSKVYVDVLCDYCNKNIINKTYQIYIKQNKNAIINKDCCNDCKPIKIKESNLLIYGVESTNQVSEIRNKQMNTCLEKYGGYSPSCDKDIKKKIIRTNINRYGTKTPAENEEIKNKIKSTNLVRYGSTSPTLNNSIREKQINTTLKKYKVKYPMQNETIVGKARKSLYENNSVSTSRQQIYINNILNGELNFPQGNSNLDIAFPDERIYIECDFGGHELQIKFGNVTEKEFSEYEKRRWYALYRNGWKEIRIISKQDKLPYENKIKEMIQYAKDYLNQGHSWIRFNIDNNEVITSQYTQFFDYGKLKRVYKKEIAV